MDTLSIRDMFQFKYLNQNILYYQIQYYIYYIYKNTRFSYRFGLKDMVKALYSIPEYFNCISSYVTD